MQTTEEKSLPIEDRLRARCKRGILSVDGDTYKELLEAAAEIERLRKALEKIEGIATNWNKDGGTLLSALGAVQFHARQTLDGK